jgi:hypothetical protein
MVRLKGLLSSFVLNNRLPCLATSRFLPVRNGEVRVGASRLAAHTSPSALDFRAAREISRQSALCGPRRLPRWG